MSPIRILPELDLFLHGGKQSLFLTDSDILRLVCVLKCDDL